MSKRICKKWSEQEEHYVKENYGKMTCKEIGEHLGRSVGSVRKHLSYLGLNRPRNKYHFNATYFNTIDSPEKAYWLGFIAADGCIIDDSDQHNSGQHKRVKIALKASDQNHLVKFRDCIDSNNPIKIEKSVHNEWNIDTDECVITIYSSSMVDDLERKGLTYKLPFPTTREVPHNLMSHYIRGFIDADGSFTSRTRGENNRRVAEFSVVGATKSFLESMAAFLNEELETSIRLYDKRAGNWRIVASSRQDVLKILDYAYDCKDITRNSYLDRKYEKYQRVRQELAVCVGDYADNKLGRNWKPKLDISMVIRVEGSKEPHAEHSR